MLQLYRCLLRYGQTLQLSDRLYFYRRVRLEFDKSRSVQEEHRRRFLFEVNIGMPIFKIAWFM